MFKHDINNEGEILTYIKEFPTYSVDTTNFKGKNINGTMENNLLTGNKKPDFVSGGKGDDIISGKGKLKLGKSIFNDIVEKIYVTNVMMAWTDQEKKRYLKYAFPYHSKDERVDLIVSDSLRAYMVYNTKRCP